MKRLKQTISGSWGTVVATFQELRASQVLSYPVASLATTLLLSLLLIRPWLGPVTDAVELPSAVGRRLAVIVLFWALMEITSGFFAVALLNALSGRLDGRHSSFAACLSVARRQWWPILQYAVLQTPVNALVFFVRPLSVPLRLAINRLTRNELGLSFDAITMMILPPIALERRGFRDAVQRGKELVRLSGTKQMPVRPPALGPIMLLLWLPALLIFSPPLLLHAGPTPLDLALGRIGIAIAVLALICAQQLDVFVSSVSGLAAYRCALGDNTDVYVDEPSAVPEAGHTPAPGAGS